MTTTNLSLIQQVQAGEEVAWARMDRLYRPLITHWLRRNSLPVEDVEDLTQEVMATVHRKIPEFDHNGRRGAFRRWLRNITLNCCRGFVRSRRLRRPGVGSDQFLQMLEQLEDPDSDVARRFDQQHDEYLVRELLAAIAEEYAPHTMQAFRLYVLEENDAADVAESLGISVASVYSARSRILQRLRLESAQLLGEDVFE